MSKISRSLMPVVFSGALIFASASSGAEKPAAPVPAPQQPAYPHSQGVRTIMNPHNQISDEGSVIWGSCMVCHKNIPDIKEAKSIKDVQLRFDEENLNEICLKCHVVKKHPGGEGIGAMMSGFVAPDHLVKPNKTIALNIRLILKDIPTILPLDPKSGNIICATCHNPHERGLLVGRADYGADYNLRLRSAGLDICEYCHRK